MAKSSKKNKEAPLEPVIESVLTFDGQDDWIELPPASIPSGNEITCSFWAYGGDALPRANSVIEAQNAKGQRLLNVHLLWNNSHVYFDCGITGASFDNYDRLMKQLNAADCKGKWSHWAFTKNATIGVMKIYLNGELWHQETGKTIPIPPTAKARLGSSFAPHYYPGKLAEVQIWSRDRTQAEIQQDMHRRLVGDEPGLVSYWPLNEGTGAIAHDKTSNANHGTIHGNPTWEVSTLSLVDATASQSEEEASSLPETPTQASPAPTVNLPTGSKIKLKSWKGDYLHRPDSAQGVTTGGTGAGNEWTVEVLADNKIKLKSSKGDYLHRPDSAQGVTTWSTGVGNEWTVEAIADHKIKLKSWKGDYLHRPDSPPDVTTWNTGVGNEWEFEVISIEEPAGSASASPNVSPSPSTLPPEQLAELIHPVPILSEGYANEQSGELGEAASAPPNVAPLPSQPSVESSPPVTPTPAIAPPIPPVRLQGRQMVLVLDDKHQGISAGGGALRPQGRFTIEAWVYPATNAGKQVIFAEGGTLFYLEGGELKFQATPAAEAISSVGAGLVAGNWYHVAVARAGSRPGDTKLYINGVHNDNQAAISPILSFGNTYLGGQPDVSDSRFQGKLLEVRVWRFARSQAEIEANRLYPMTGRELGLVRYWSLNQTVGSTLHDKTTNRAVGTLSGDAVWEEVEIPLKLKLDAQERLTRSTGLEDYGYWFKEMAKQQKTEADPPFLRGRIWA